MIILLSVVAFAVASFVVQAASHFAINKAHYQSVPFMRPSPILPMGIGVMVLQGVVLGIAYEFVADRLPGLSGILIFCLGAWAFFAPYLAFVEPSKYEVPNIGRWIVTEATSSLIQFVAYGVLLGLALQFFG